MKEIFDIRRFSRLFLKHTAEHFRTYLMAAGILAGFLLLSGAFLILVDVDPDISFQMASYAIVLFVSCGLFTSTIFADYGEKTRAIQALTLPATSFEKFLIGWLWSYPIFLVVYTAVFYLALWGLSSLQSADHHEFVVFSLLQRENIVLFVLFTEVHALSLYGAIFFSKPQFVRTGFSFFLALGLTFLLNTIFLKVLTGVRVIKMAVPFGYLNFAAGDKEYSIGMGQDTSVPVLLLILLVAIATWVAAYYRLREKRV